MRPETALAGLPRLVRLPAELRWRGQALAGTAVCVALFWVFAWLLGEPVRPPDTGLALAAAALPTALAGALGMGSRVARALATMRRAPRASVHETAADARERRATFAAGLLTGVVALLILDHLIGAGGVMAGLAAGLFLPLGLVDLAEARRYEAAEAEREVRLFALIGRGALIPRFGLSEVYETPRPGARRDLEPSPFDLEL